RHRLAERLADHRTRLGRDERYGGHVRTLTGEERRAHQLGIDLAQARYDRGGAGERVGGRGEVRVRNGDDAEAGGDGGENAVGRVFDGDALVRRRSEALGRRHVDVGGRLAVL